jgi:hypothetical protein
LRFVKLPNTELLEVTQDADERSKRNRVHDNRHQSAAVCSFAFLITVQALFKCRLKQVLSLSKTGNDLVTELLPETALFCLFLP